MRSATRRSLNEAIPDLTMGPDPEDDCTACAHNWGDHLLLSEANPPLSGHTECPVIDCDCFTTWDVPQAIEMYSKRN